MLSALSQRLHNVRTLAEAGIIRPARPDRLVRVARALHRFGPTPAAGYEACAARYPHEAGIIDELRPAHYRFSHILVRDAVEEALGAEQRAAGWGF